MFYCIKFKEKIIIQIDKPQDNGVLLLISGNETNDYSKAHLSSVARKPEETCKFEKLSVGEDSGLTWCGILHIYKHLS